MTQDVRRPHHLNIHNEGKKSMFRQKSTIHILRIAAALSVLALLLAACSAPAAVTPAAGLPTVAPTDAPLPVAQSPELTADLNGLAQGFSAQVIAAVPPTTDGPYWEALPEYTRLDLTGYPIGEHLMKPQIFIYPLSELAAANPGAGQIAADLQTLLQTQQVGKNLPFLPLFNASQVMHAQVQFLDFKNGQGVRFVTQFDQAPLPINNHELIYTYQGLTSDGKYYVAALLPVNLAGLPADETITGQESPEFVSDFLKYLETTVSLIDQQPASAFTPDLSTLDALIQSIEIK